MTRAMRTASVVLAAGLSRRLGRPKQLLVKEGRILLAYVLEEVLAARPDELVLVLGHVAGEVRAALAADPGPGTGIGRPRSCAQSRI